MLWPPASRKWKVVDVVNLAGKPRAVSDRGGPEEGGDQAAEHGGPGGEGRGGEVAALAGAAYSGAGQEGEGQHVVSGVDGAEHGGSGAGGAVTAAGSQVHGGHARQLEARGPGRHLARRLRRGGQAHVPAGLRGQGFAIQERVPTLHSNRNHCHLIIDPYYLYIYISCYT